MKYAMKVGVIALCAMVIYFLFWNSYYPQEKIVGPHESITLKHGDTLYSNGRVVSLKSDSYFELRNPNGIEILQADLILPSTGETRPKYVMTNVFLQDSYKMLFLATLFSEERTEIAFTRSFVGTPFYLIILISMISIIWLEIKR